MFRLSQHPQQQNNYSRIRPLDFYVATTKPDLLKALSDQKPDTIKTNNKGGYSISANSNYIVSSITHHHGEVIIDSAIELNTDTTSNITDLLNKNISQIDQNKDPKDKEHLTLSALQESLDKELGIISDVSSAESEQTQAIQSSETGIVNSKKLKQKMCTLRAGYMMKVLENIGREAYTICGAMEGEGHARVIAKTPSGEALMIDPMNPKTGQGYRFVNSIILPSSSTYDSIKNGSYTGPLTMNGNDYHMNIAA